MRVCVRVISDLHNTAAPSPGKVTPKTKGEPQLLGRREDLKATLPSQRSGKQSGGTGRALGRCTAPATSTEPDPHTAAALRHARCIWPQSKPYCQESKVGEGNRARAGHTFSGCSLFVWGFLPSGLFSIILSLSLVILLSVACLSHLTSVPKPWHDTRGHSLPFLPISPTNWLPVPVFTSQAISFCWRLAATHHLRGARNIVNIGAVSLPNKMALMELLFNLVCFVSFFRRRTIKNQLRHFN